MCCLSLGGSHYHKMCIKRQDGAKTRGSYRATSCGVSAPFLFFSLLSVSFDPSFPFLLLLGAHSSSATFICSYFFTPAYILCISFFPILWWFTAVPHFLVPTLNCDPPVLKSLWHILFPHSTSLLSVALHLCYLCVVFRLPRFLQQSAQSGTSSALGLPRTPHRSHLWRTCLPQQGPYEEPKSEPGAGHRPLPQQYR